MIIVNPTKAANIAHDIRRHDRDEKMKPLDTEATIPSMSEEAEAKREAVRVANAKVQEEIDAAAKKGDVEGIKKALSHL